MSPSFNFIALSILTIISYPCLALHNSFPYGSQPVRGVNLGGWLVLEPWITPSIFDNTGNAAIVDEWTFCQYQPVEVATAALYAHWNTFITEADFLAIANAGLNHVRLPIGYWAFDVSSGEPFVQGQIPYLKKAVSWASNHGLKVIVDLHGAPGSQNGFDNSGQRKPFPEWQSDPNNIARTNAIIKTLASMFADDETVSIIAPLNEPAGFDGDAILTATKQFWLDSYGSIRYPYGSKQTSNTIEMIHDAFQPLNYWKGWQTYPQYNRVAMDTHIYQVFSNGEVARTESEHISSACSQQSSLAGFDLWLIVGEWSPAMTDCAKYLNGRGVGSRYDGSYPGSVRVGSCQGLTGSALTFSSSYKKFLRQFWEAQVISYEAAANGWLQWTWKAENADEWSYQAGLAHGWIPHDPTDHQYPNICN